jgi:hypothetical protein
MSYSRRSRDWFHFYSGSFRKGAHQLLSWGYEDARSKIRADHEEEKITGFIVTAIRKRLYDDPTTPLRFKIHYDIHEEQRDWKSEKTGKRRPRIDIVATCSFKLPRPEFMFEAKLLRKNGFPIGKYTGKDGMQCYIRGVYAAEYPAAAMVGYIQSGTSERWFKQLKRKFDSDDGGLCIHEQLRKINVVKSLPDEWVSVHSRKNNVNIEIFHIFLDCT